MRRSDTLAVEEPLEVRLGGRAYLVTMRTPGDDIDLVHGLLHGEGVAAGLGLAAALSARLGHCAQELPGRVMAHLAACGLPARIADLPRPFSVQALVGRMRRDKKVRDGQLRFVLLRAPGDAFTASDVPAEAVEALLRDEGCGE